MIQLILSDLDIIEYIAKGEIVIEPELKAEQMQPSSIDLTLGNEFGVVNQKKTTFIDPNIETHMQYNFYDEFYIMEPKEFVLGTTVEKIKLPDNLVARIEGRSSIGRLGLTVHSTAGYIDPGFEGQITLELTNEMPVPWILYPGWKICQLAFEELKTPCCRPYGHPELNSKYQGQEGVQGSRSFMD